MRKKTHFIKLSSYCKIHNITYPTAHRRFTTGKLKGFRKETGTIWLEPELPRDLVKEKTALIFCSCFSENPDNISLQEQLCKEYCEKNNIAIYEIIFDKHRDQRSSKLFLKALPYRTWNTLVVYSEFSAPAVPMVLESFLKMQGRTLEIVNEDATADSAEILLRTESIIRKSYSSLVNYTHSTRLARMFMHLTDVCFPGSRVSKKRTLQDVAKDDYGIVIGKDLTSIQQKYIEETIRFTAGKSQFKSIEELQSNFFVTPVRRKRQPNHGTIGTDKQESCTNGTENNPTPSTDGTNGTVKKRGRIENLKYVQRKRNEEEMKQYTYRERIDMFDTNKKEVMTLKDLYMMAVITGQFKNATTEEQQLIDKYLD